MCVITPAHWQHNPQVVSTKRVKWACVEDSKVEVSPDLWRPHLPGRDLLQSILAFGKTRILHDDHDDWHLLVNQCQGPVLQLPSQDAF